MKKLGIFRFLGRKFKGKKSEMARHRAIKFAGIFEKRHPGKSARKEGGFKA